MQVGHAVEDITPQVGITLSGFVARRNQPSEGVDDPLYVHALAAEHDGRTVLLLVFDLLGLGGQLTGEIHAAIEPLKDRGVRPETTILCTTHTHSGPATVKLIGCGVPERAYWDRLVWAARSAAEAALADMRPARLRYAVKDLPGVSYNRRKVLADGRVVMAERPDDEVVRVGPTWDRLVLLRFEDTAGNPIVGAAHWAAHPCVVCSRNISADYPGELRRRLTRIFDMPFFFIQGACGNVNLPFTEMTRREMLADVDVLTGRLGRIDWCGPAAVTPFAIASDVVKLAYGPMRRRRELESTRDHMGAIAETGQGPEAEIHTLANILNVPPGRKGDEEMMRYVASVLAEWADRLLESSGELPGSCDLALKVWTVGELTFCAVAAEVFAETAAALQRAFADRVVSVIGCAAPLVGYLPTDEAMAEGGYDVDYAYRFYGHPAGFARGSEPAVVRSLSETILSMTGGT